MDGGERAAALCPSPVGEVCLVGIKRVKMDMAMLRMIWKAQVTNHLAKVLCSDNVDDHGDEDENKTKRQKYKGTTANLCCNPKDA